MTPKTLQRELATKGMALRVLDPAAPALEAYPLVNVSLPPEDPFRNFIGSLLVVGMRVRGMSEQLREVTGDLYEVVRAA